MVHFYVFKQVKFTAQNTVAGWLIFHFLVSSPTTCRRRCNTIEKQNIIIPILNILSPIRSLRTRSKRAKRHLATMDWLVNEHWLPVEKFSSRTPSFPKSLRCCASPLSSRARCLVHARFPLTRHSLLWFSLHCAHFPPQIEEHGRFTCETYGKLLET